MKKLTLILLFVSTTFSFAQNTIEVSPDKNTKIHFRNLDEKIKKFNVPDLRTAPYNAIRVWEANQVTTYANGNTYVSLFENNETLKKEYPFEVSYAGIPENAITIASLKEVTPKFPIDCFRKTIEIVENGKYYRKTVGCDDDSYKLALRPTFSNAAQTAYNDFLKTLEPGQYRFGMSSKNLDYPITNEADKSELYKLLEKKLAEKQITIQSTPFGHPTFHSVSTKKTYTYKEFNEIPFNKVKDISIYGSGDRVQVLVSLK